MSRYYLDCHDLPGAGSCTISIAADNEDELLEAAASYLAAIHGVEDGPALRERLRERVRNEAAELAATYSRQGSGTESHTVGGVIGRR